MLKMINEWMTIKEVLDKEIKGDYRTIAYSGSPDDLNNIHSMFTSRFGNAGLDETSLKVLNEYVFPRYMDWYAFQVKDEDKLESYIDAFIANVLNFTLIKSKSYVPMIKALETVQEKLMLKVETTTEMLSAFNDTPQEENLDGKYFDEKYMSNTSSAKTRTATDANTPAGRLKEINESIVNIYEKWSDEYANIFYRKEEEL